MSTSSEWDEAVDELYAMAPGDFVAARNALAKQMKADGGRDEAAAVAKLKKPSVVAWALNQAVRADRDQVGALIEAAERQSVAQQDLLEGGDADALRAATADRRDAARAVGHAAEAVAGPTHADAVRTTLDAAVADSALVDRLRSGTLVDTLDAPAGFGVGFGLGGDDEAGDTPAPRRARASRAPARRKVRTAEADDDGEGDEEDDGAQERAEAQEAARREAESMVARLERELARAEKWVGRAERSVAAAGQEAEAAAEALTAAQQRVDDAEAERTRAEQELADKDAERARQAELLDHARALLDELDGEA